MHNAYCILLSSLGIEANDIPDHQMRRSRNPERLRQRPRRSFAAQACHVVVVAVVVVIVVVV